MKIIVESLPIRPYQLLCLLCAGGGDRGHMPGREAIVRLTREIRRDPNRPLQLVCHADGIFGYQNPRSGRPGPGSPLLNEKRDLDILQRLGLVPGDTRPARDLLARAINQFTNVRDLCGGTRGGKWRGCPRARTGRYERGVAAGLAALVPPRDSAEKAKDKALSAERILKAGRLEIRPHHLLCICCFHRGRKNFEPIAEDNVAEAIMAMQRKPDIPVKLVRGCCMVCPPCSAYDARHKICVGGISMSLRDQKRDLDVLRRLNLGYGDSLPARALMRRIFKAFKERRELCGFGDNVVRAAEWTICGAAAKPDAYALARRHGMGIV